MDYHLTDRMGELRFERDELRREAGHVEYVVGNYQAAESMRRQADDLDAELRELRRRG